MQNTCYFSAARLLPRWQGRLVSSFLPQHTSALVHTQTPSSSPSLPSNQRPKTFYSLRKFVTSDLGTRTLDQGLSLRSLKKKIMADMELSTQAQVVFLIISDVYMASIFSFLLKPEISFVPLSQSSLSHPKSNTNSSIPWSFLARQPSLTSHSPQPQVITKLSFQYTILYKILKSYSFLAVYNGNTQVFFTLKYNKDI